MAIEAVHEPRAERADRLPSPTQPSQSGGKIASKVQNSHVAFSKQDSGTFDRSRSAGHGSRSAANGPSRSASVGPTSKLASSGASPRQSSSAFDSKPSLSRQSSIKAIGNNKPTSKATNSVPSKSHSVASVAIQSGIHTSKSSSCGVSPRQSRQGRSGRGAVAEQGSLSLPSSPKNDKSRDTKSPAARERTPSFGPQGARSRSPSLPGHAELLWESTAIELQTAEAKVRKRCDELETEGFQLRERLLHAEQAEEEGRSRTALLENKVAQLDRERADLSMQVAVMADRAEQERASKLAESSLNCDMPADIELTSEEPGLMQVTQFEQEREELLALADQAKMESLKREAERDAIRAELATALAAEAENERAQRALRTELDAAKAKQERDLSNAKAQLAVAKADLEEQIRRQQQIQADLAAKLADRDEQDRAQQRVHSDFAARMIHQLEEERARHATEVAEFRAQLAAASAEAFDREKQKCESDDGVIEAAEKLNSVAKVDTRAVSRSHDTSAHVPLAADSQRSQSFNDLRKPVTMTSSALKDERTSLEKFSNTETKKSNCTRNRSSSYRKSAPAQRNSSGRASASAPPEKARAASSVAIVRSRALEHKASCIDRVWSTPDEQLRDAKSLANLPSTQPSLDEGLKEATDQFDDRSTKASSCMYGSLENSVHESLENSDLEAEMEDHNVLVQRQYSAKITSGGESPTDHHYATQENLGASSEQLTRGADYTGEDEADEFEAGLVELYNDGYLQLTEMCPCDSDKPFGECHFISLGLHQCEIKKRDNVLQQCKPCIPVSPSLMPLAYSNAVRDIGDVAGAFLGKANVLPQHQKVPEVRGIHPAVCVATAGPENVVYAPGNRIAPTQNYPAQSNFNQVRGQPYLPPRHVVSVAAPSTCSTHPSQGIAKATGASLLNQHIPAVATPLATHRPDQAMCCVAPVLTIPRQASIPTKTAAVPAMQAHKVQRQQAENVGAATKDDVLVKPTAQVQERAQPRPRSHHTPFERA